MNSPVKPLEDPAAWRVGAAAADLTPDKPAFLYGYPHENRISTGVHDPLLAGALWIESGPTRCLFVGCDLIWLPRKLTDRLRQELSTSLGLPTEAILLSATHTHSGPVMSRMLSNEADPVVPPPDEAYLQKVTQAVIDAATRARDATEPATLSLATIDAAGLGGNRRDPDGPTIPRWPVLFVTPRQSDTPSAVMSVCAMHPTVLHEDSTVISGDFPGLARQGLQNTFSPQTLYLHHMGASGNQSPRRAVSANTLTETQRLGDLLAQRIAEAYRQAESIEPTTINARSRSIDLPLRTLPEPADARAARDRALDRLNALRESGEDKAATRTAEVDWFGAEETLTLSQAASEGRLRAAAEQCLPAEVQVIKLGTHTFIGWPGEVFVEFALDVMATHDNTHMITLANGDLQGYLVTQQAVDENAYEAGNAIFASPESGQRMVQSTRDLLDELTRPTA